MNLQNGLFRVEFRDQNNYGCGVVNFLDGQARGGDGTMAYSGVYSVNGDKMSATIRVFKHSNVEGLISALNPYEYVLELDGTHSGDGFVLQGKTPSIPDNVIHIIGEIIL